MELHSLIWSIEWCEWSVYEWSNKENKTKS